MDKRGNMSSRNMRLFAAIMTLIEALVLTSLTGCADKKVDYGTDTEKLTKSAVCNVKDFSTDETYSDEFSVQTEIGNVNIDISAKVELPDCKRHTLESHRFITMIRNIGQKHSFKISLIP